MSEGLIKDAYEVIVKEIQLFLSLAYVFMIAVGMLFNHCKYSCFGINIFEYADILDFLIAPFADIKIIVFTLGSLSFSIAIFVLDRYWYQNYPDSYTRANFGMNLKSWYSSFRWFSFVGLFLAYTYIMALGYGKSYKKEIDQQSKIHITYVDETEEEGMMIGKTKEVLFLWVGEKVKIIPLASHVKEMEIFPKPKKKKKLPPVIDPAPE